MRQPSDFSLSWYRLFVQIKDRLTELLLNFAYFSGNKRTVSTLFATASSQEQFNLIFKKRRFKYNTDPPALRLIYSYIDFAG